MISIKLMEIEQPIGTFYFGKIKMSQLKLIAFTRKRKNNIGIQRQIKDKKVSDIEYKEFNDIINEMKEILNEIKQNYSNNDVMEI